MPHRVPLERAPSFLGNRPALGRAMLLALLGAVHAAAPAAAPATTEPLALLEPNGQDASHFAFADTWCSAEHEGMLCNKGGCTPHIVCSWFHAEHTEPTEPKEPMEATRRPRVAIICIFRPGRGWETDCAPPRMRQGGGMEAARRQRHAG